MREKGLYFAAREAEELAIIYSMGANESPKGRRIFFGVLGVVMIIAFVCASVYLHKYGWPL